MELDPAIGNTCEEKQLIRSLSSLNFLKVIQRLAWSAHDQKVVGSNPEPVFLENLLL